MAKAMMKRTLSLCLVVAMLLTMCLSVGVYATGNSESEETGPAIEDYATFLSCLKVLDGYAQAYAQENSGENANALIINYIRTGVERYTSGTWEIVCGKENTAFTAYVEKQDAANGTSASMLKNLKNFNLPNGDIADLGHVFGAMDVANYAKMQGMSDAAVSARADMGSWAGDIADLMFCAENVDIADKVDTSETDVEILSANIRERYLGADYATLNEVDHSFTSTDLCGDLDAFYLTTEMNKGGKTLSEIVESYFVSDLTDATRASYFLTSRLGGMVTKAGIRKTILNIYSSNTLIGALESSYSLTDLSNCDTLRKACCYAFADYLCDLAGDPDGVDPIIPDSNPEPNPETNNDYYSVFSTSTSTLAPGVTQTINYALTKDNKQIVYYIATADVARNDVSIHANYHANDPTQGWSMSRITEQMAAAQSRHTDESDPDHYVANYNAIVGVNADFYNMVTGAPAGALVMEGVEYNGVGNENFFAILKDGTPIIGSASDYATYKGQIAEAVGGSVYLVKDGKSVVSSSNDYYNNRHSRTCVGITAMGQVVLMALDGRQEPFSAGGSAEELAQIMLDAGCVVAINLDGGGSTTFVAKQEGSDSLSVINRPSDGYERSISSSLMIVSTAPNSKEFDHALVSSDYDYLTVGASVQLSASGVSASGSSAALPEGCTWESADSSVGTVSDKGVFTAVKKGSVEVNLISGGVVVGSKTLNVVEPTGLKFSKTSVNAIYGQPVHLPLIAIYNENPVAISPDDITFDTSNDAGIVTLDAEGFAFVADEESGLRNTVVTAMLSRDYSISADIKVAMYGADQMIFDFDNVTSGDRTFAWIREVGNSELIPSGENELSIYHAIDPGKAMGISYTFALDMTTIDVPEALQPLLAMVAGGDVDGVTAWNLLLQLAERVSSLTEVSITFNFDKNLDVDISNLTVSNDYFTLTDATIDENNVLKIKCNFVKQSQAIDPDTANPICILSGIKMTPKNGAAWDADSLLKVVNSGSVGYDIYLGANALYTMSCQTSFQETYGIYPYQEPENTIHPAGGHFYCESYQDFTDSFVLDSGSWSGWKTMNGVSYYFKDNVALKGIHYVSGLNDPENKYYYKFNESTGVCEGKLNGLFQIDGCNYYAISGTLKSGWWEVTEANGEIAYYYFDKTTFRGLNGKNSSFFPNVTYTFENGKLIEGAWLKNSKGTRYYYGPDYVQFRWFTIEGNRYYFDQSGYRYEGLKYVKLRNNHDDPMYWYEFGKDGICHGVYDHTGLFYLNGNTYYTIGGKVCNGLYLAEDGFYYYFESVNYTAVKNERHWVNTTNGLLPAGYYNFDKDGRLVFETPDPTKKNGLIEENGDLYYYFNDVKTYAGLILVDGSYYYINSSCKAVTSSHYWVYKTNDLLPEGYYDFGADGKMIIDTKPDPAKKNGLVKENGELYYYVNGVKTYAGLIVIDGSYYYINSSCKAVTSSHYWVYKTNNLLPEGYYDFDTDGKMIGVAPKPDTGKCDGGANCPSKNFTDVSVGFWGHEAIDYTVAAGIFKGMSETEFGPNLAMTRGMLVTVLYRMQGSPDISGYKNPFSDVDKSNDRIASYYDAILWAYETGVTKGYPDGTFMPDGEMTREELATFLYRYATNIVGRDTAKETRSDLSGYTDTAIINGSHLESIQWAVGQGLMQGMTDTTINPKESATRAQLATLLMRFIEEYNT